MYLKKIQYEKSNACESSNVVDVTYVIEPLNDGETVRDGRLRGERSTDVVRFDCVAKEWCVLVRKVVDGIPVDAAYVAALAAHEKKARELSRSLDESWTEKASVHAEMGELQRRFDRLEAKIEEAMNDVVDVLRVSKSIVDMEESRLRNELDDKGSS